MEESEKVKEFKVAVEDGPDLGDFIAGVVPRWVAGGGLVVPLTWLLSEAAQSAPYC